MHQDPEGAEIKPRPIVLHVSRVTETTDPDVTPSTVLEIELTKQDVYKLVAILSQKLGEGEAGLVRVRLFGTLRIP